MVSQPKDSKRQNTDLLSEVWREACRHLEIHEALATIRDRLRERLPIERFLIRDFDRHRQIVATLHGGVGQQDATPCSPVALKRLCAWAEDGELVQAGDIRRESPSIARILPPKLSNNALIGGLAGVHGARGLLVIDALASTPFKAEHQRFALELLDPLSVALDNHHQLRELIDLRTAAEADKQSLLTRLGRDSISEAVIGARDGLKAVFDRVSKVCGSDLPVLILGETGSGKEVVAREIHTRSPRLEGPFIRVNCGAIPSELIDSELFGHEKGSFTGAINQRLGWFERAHQGTLFLDEVGELSLAAQVRLLRVLQDGLIQRVGGAGDIPIDVRIVAATHRDLPKLIQESRFREDLWYRLATFPIVLPPLRERRGDIAALASHFARRASTRFGLRLQLPQQEDLVLLCGYDWPGNVRELAAVMDRATILGEGGRLEVAKALGTPFSTSKAAIGSPPPIVQGDLPPSVEKHLTLDEAMRQHIGNVLAATHGRIEGQYGAARLLAINPHTLRARMRKLGVEWNKFKA